MSQYSIDDGTNFSNNMNSFNVWNHYTLTDERSQLLAWLSHLEPKLRHRDIQERRVENVGEWFMQTEQFRSWNNWSGEGESDNAVLFCCGDPGVGKTFINSLVVDRLRNQAKGKNAAVTCCYFNFAARNEQSAASVLGSLLKQMVSGMEGIPEEISCAFREQKKAIGGCGAQLVDIVKMLQAVTSAQPTFICIDAVDECAPVQRLRLLDSLGQVLEKSPGSRIFVTGRPHIRAEVEKRLSGRVISVCVGPPKDDIVTYLRARLGEDETPDAMDKNLEADILEKMLENIPEMFLLVSLNIEAILKESTIYRRRERLNKITKGSALGDVYGATIERIMAQDGDKSRFGMAALMWISHAERPLRPDELCHALAVELSSTEINAGNVPSISTLVGCCQGLITVDKDESAVRLIHFTLQEYLSAHPNLTGRPHKAMTDICLTYLNCQQVKAISPNLLDIPFLEYCSVYWGVHAKRDLSSYSRSLALELLQEYEGHISTKYLLEQAGYLDLVRSDSSFPFSGLHCASFFGIVEVVAAFVEIEGCDIDEGDLWGCTPLAWAARNGHEGAVKILVERGVVNPNKSDKYGRTPLSHAAGRGHGGVVRILLGREEVNPNKPDNNGQTPLSCAAWNGHEDVVKILLGREEVNPNKAESCGQTPLSYAAQAGHVGVVKILVEYRVVNSNKPDKGGRTPLSHAAARGHEGVVKTMLARKDVNPDKPDNYNQTPLWYAASSGHQGVAKILLRREGVNPNRPNNAGQTPLVLASWKGREGVVKILLELAEVDPDKSTAHGRTPLAYAAEHGHEGVVEMLLGREGVNPNKSDSHGQTPLMCASRWGHRRVIALLQSHEAVTHSTT